MRSTLNKITFISGFWLFKRFPAIPLGNINNKQKEMYMKNTVQMSFFILLLLISLSYAVCTSNVEQNCSLKLRNFGDKMGLQTNSVYWKDNGKCGRVQYPYPLSLEENKSRAKELIKECKSCGNFLIITLEKCIDNIIKQDSIAYIEKIKQDKLDSIANIEKMKRDSIEKINLELAKKESSDEINALIEKGTEVDFILDKCDKYKQHFNELLQICQHIRQNIQQNIQDTIYLTIITNLLKDNKLEEAITACNDYADKSLEICTKMLLTYTLRTPISYHPFAERIRSQLETYSNTGGIRVCNDYGDKSYYMGKSLGICTKDLVNKVKKLPLKKIDSPKLAEVYFSPFYKSDAFTYQKIPKNSNVQIKGKIIQNDGKKARLELSGDDFFVKHSGQCFMRENADLDGFGKYIGEETYTTVIGGKRTIPAFQLLWCDE